MAFGFSQNFRRRNLSGYFIKVIVKECINCLYDCYNMTTFAVKVTFYDIGLID